MNKKKDISTQDKATLESTKTELDKKLASLVKEMEDINSVVNNKKEEYKNYINQVLNLHNKLQTREDISKSVNKLVTFI